MSKSSFSFFLRPAFLVGVTGVGGLLFSTDTGTPPPLLGGVAGGGGAGILRGAGLVRAGLFLAGETEEVGGGGGVGDCCVGITMVSLWLRLCPEAEEEEEEDDGREAWR